MPSTSGFLGFDNFIWFQAVVEDRFDPLKLGRLRIRILGLHTQDKNSIPTAELPWAYPITPITSASMNGIGDAPVGPVEGSWVVGFFRDGDNCQEPVVFGTIGGIPQEKGNKRIGFVDPTNFYPNDEYLLEPDTNRLARNEKISETVIQQRKDKLVRNVYVALQDRSNNGGAREEDDDRFWSEPAPIYDAKYPFNHVYQTESGHIKEWDDTKDKTRIHEYHQLGTFYEVFEVEEGGKKKANKLTKVNGTNYSIILGEDNIYVSGSCNITVHGRCNLYAANDINIEANEKASIVVKGNTTLYCHQNISMTAEKDFNITAGGDFNVTADNTRFTVTNNYSVNTTKGSIAMASKTTMGLSSILNMNISASTSTIINSTISTELGSVGSVTVNGGLTSINSLLGTTVGSLTGTKIKTGTGITIESITSAIVLKSLKSINLSAPLVARIFPTTAAVGKLIFDPIIPPEIIP